MAGLSPNNNLLQLNMTIQNTDLLSGGAPVVMARTVGPLTYKPSNTCYFESFGVSTNTPLVFLSFYAVLYVRNLDPVAGITLAVTFNSGAAQSIFLPAGSVFLYFSGPPFVGGGGITGGSITNLQATSTTPTANGGGSPIELLGAF